MPIAVPTLTYPWAPSYVVTGREITAATAATAYAGIKCAAFRPNNRPTWLKDDALWGDMVKIHDLQQGPIWAEHEIPESPLYGDTFGYIAHGFWGDYVATGTAASPNSTLSGSVAAGATTVTLVSGTGFLANQNIQIDTGVNAEIVTIASVATNTLTLNAATPLRFSHNSAVAVTNTTAPYTHTFATMNPGGTTQFAPACQPPSHTFWHVNTPAGSGNFFADQFLYGIITELSVSGKASGWTTWSAKITSYSQTAPSGALTVTLSAVKGIPAWKSTTSIAASQYNAVPAWSATWTRVVDVIPTADGAQSPYAILLGQVDSKFKMSFNPALDESQLNYMLNNTQPSLQWSVSNGLSGANLVSLAINSNLSGYENAPLTANRVAWGYEVDGEFVGSTTYAGNSGGRTVSQMVLQNGIPTY